MQPNFQHTDLPSGLRLGPDDVHIWWLSLDPPLQSLPERLALLSDDEKARAARFRFEQHRLRYIAGRACLRQLLGGYLGINPARIEFVYSAHSKPGLKTAPAGPVLQFNLSNSEQRALIVFSWQRLVGIDLEFLYPLQDEDDFAGRFFCASETALIHSLSGAEKTRAFFELWTSKEALLKAMGDGLTRPINEMEVALGQGRARLISIAGEPVPTSAWQLDLFQPAPGYQAAVAVEGPSFKTSFYQVVGDFNAD